MSRLKVRLTGLLSAFVIVSTLFQGTASAAPWANRSAFVSPKFEEVWRRSDDPRVRDGRSLYWGFGPWFDYNEYYRESPNGLRRVQYFDKARMEINGINGNTDVTNGLLVVELVSGQLKTGDNAYDNAFRNAADRVPVAGDGYQTNSNSPTYASFAAVSTFNNNGYRDPDRRDQSVADAIDKSGNKSTRNDLRDAYKDQTKLVVYNATTGHNIPQVFWDFLNRTGPIVVNGQRTTGSIVDWTSAMGLPISDPYWVKATVGGVQKDILVQLFERRILTYTPTNDAAYQVEMGNVGQHYFQWRYTHLGTPWNSSEPSLPIAFGSKRDGGAEWDTYTMNGDGTSQLLYGSNDSKETVPYSWVRSWDPSKVKLFVDSRRGNGANRQIWMVGADGAMTRVTYTDGTPTPPGVPYQGYVGTPSNDYNASVSPDGSKLAFVSDRSGKPQIFVSYTNGASQTQVTLDDCVNETPSWSADGRYLYWAANCGTSAKYNVYRAELNWLADQPTNDYPYLSLELRNKVNLTNSTTSDNGFPRVSPDGTKIVFTSNRDGNSEVYLMNADGSNQTRLTNSSAEDSAPSWKLDGSKIAFDSNRDGNWNIYVMNTDGTGQAQLTNNSADDRWNVWGQ
ncbi:LpqB family beta-propeller domain-containing protein [Herpetosiphon llansteffanensis]|uniref:LpqB family beta-propeller domain-containing protein n=1 Tax=Herpetosiphon llansteffanensis TaxID=2094568 RepID=UPI000D7C4F67|nr:LpqB family beta-propeller domain-containing protein [Herpetosiphon llansteffanensis]